MEFLIDDISASGSELAVSLVSDFEGMNEKTNAATKQELNRAVSLFATNEVVAAAIGRGGVSPSDLENTSIFLVLDESNLALYAPLLRLVTATVLHYLTARPSQYKSRIIVALDEFPQLRSDISNLLMTVRKRRVRIIACLQSLPTLFDMFGRYKAQGMIDNFTLLTVMKCTDPDTQEWLSKKAGTYWHDERQYRYIEPSEFGYLEKDLILYHPRGFMRLKKTPYWKKTMISRLCSLLTGRR